MKAIKILALFIIVTAFKPGSAFAQKNKKPEAGIRMGVSEVNITPQSTIRMGGYGARKGPSTGVHDSLYASALYFTGEQASVLVITVDVIGLNAEFIDDAKKMISSKLSIPADNIMISALHNHGGPATQALKDEVSPAVNDYLSFLKQKLTLLSSDAASKLTAFKMGIGKGFSNLNINRRAIFADGSTGLGRNPDGPADHELGIVKFEDMNGKLLGVFVNWPCHATAGGSENNLITGDWPAAAARYIKDRAGKGVVVAMSAGASGNINPIYGPGTSFKEVELVGNNIATEALKTLSGIKTLPVKTLQARNGIVTFPGKMRTNDYLPQASYEAGPEVEVRLSTIKIGDLVLSGVSGELFTEIGLDVKKQSPYSNTFIVTHCNGSNGYICTDAAYPIGGYEVGASWLMPGIQKPLTEKFLELIHSF